MLAQDAAISRAQSRPYPHPGSWFADAVDEHRAGAGGLGAARDGDLAAHVALGQAGDLDVVDVIARVREGVAQAAEQRCLAGSDGERLAATGS